jgi:hypothetical protein
MLVFSIFNVLERGRDLSNLALAAKLQFFCDICKFYREKIVRKLRKSFEKVDFARENAILSKKARPVAVTTSREK